MIPEKKMNIAADHRWLWMTDVHLDFLDDDGLDSFFRRVSEAPAEGLLITGDIASGTDVCSFLARLDECFDGPIGFVLGNHDFYGRSITEVRDRVNALCAERHRLVYLSETAGIRISHELMLIGQDGWADGRAGDYAGSKVDLNDFGLIDEFRRKDKAHRLEIMQALSAAETQQTEHVLRDALSVCRNVILLTHVPPFTSLSLGPDRKVDPDWTPFFCAPSMGERLVEIMQAHPDQRLLVLCGHTHTPAQARVLPNLTVRVGGAQYGSPAVSDVIERADLDRWFE